MSQKGFWFTAKVEKFIQQRSSGKTSRSVSDIGGSSVPRCQTKTALRFRLSLFILCTISFLFFVLTFNRNSSLTGRSTTVGQTKSSKSAKEPRPVHRRTINRYIYNFFLPLFLLLIFERHRLSLETDRLQSMSNFSFRRRLTIGASRKHPTAASMELVVFLRGKELSCQGG